MCEVDKRFQAALNAWRDHTQDNADQLEWRQAAMRHFAILTARREAPSDEECVELSRWQPRGHGVAIRMSRSEETTEEP